MVLGVPWIPWTICFDNSSKTVCNVFPTKCTRIDQLWIDLCLCIDVSLIKISWLRMRCESQTIETPITTSFIKFILYMTLLLNYVLIDVISIMSLCFYTHPWHHYLYKLWEPIYNFLPEGLFLKGPIRTTNYHNSRQNKRPLYLSKDCQFILILVKTWNDEIIIDIITIRRDFISPTFPKHPGPVVLQNSTSIFDTDCKYSRWRHIVTL